MKVENIFLSINAANFAAQSEWWAKLIGRPKDREPMPSCHEWDLRDGVLFQVLDNAKGHGTTSVTLLISDLDAEIARLSDAGIDVPTPEKVKGFETLRYAEFADPEGNTVGLLDGR